MIRAIWILGGVTEDEQKKFPSILETLEMERTLALGCQIRDDVSLVAISFEMDQANEVAVERILEELAADDSVLAFPEDLDEDAPTLGDYATKLEIDEVAAGESSRSVLRRAAIAIAPDADISIAHFGRRGVSLG